MKLIDRNGRLFGKISVIDILVVLIVAVMAAALHFKNSQVITGTKVPDTPITYQVTVQGVRSYVADAIQEHDLLFDQSHSSDGSLGEIVEIRRGEGHRMVEMIDGTIGLLPIKDGADLVLTIRGSGLHMNKLNVDTGEVTIEGEIHTMVYTDDRPKKLFARLFQ